MPELPEVETLRRALDAKIRGARIEALQVLWRPFVAASPKTIAAAIVGKHITAIRRRGKALIFDLDHGRHLLLHLKMTGQAILHQRQQLLAFGGHPTANVVGPMPNTWTRVVLELDAARTLYINDQRKFARLRVLTSAQLAAVAFLRDMGPEALGPKFTLAAFRQRLAHHRTAPIKAALLDQRTVAGIGNIYADECLFRAKVHPERTTASLTRQQTGALHRAIRSVLKSAVAHGGTSFPDFIHDGRRHDSWIRRAGLFGHEGQPCPACGTTIVRIRVAGRGTNFCPRCQPAPEPSHRARPGVAANAIAAHKAAGHAQSRHG